MLPVGGWNKRALVYSVIVVGFFALLFGHPYVLGLSGRIHEHVFQRHIHVGMTIDDALELARRLHADDVGYNSADPFVNGASEIAYVEYVDFVTLCVSGGKSYKLLFDERGRLTGWDVEDYGSAC